MPVPRPFPLILISAGCCAAALAFAPVAAAIPDCVNTGPTTTQCQRNGNVQIATSPGVINNYPFGWPYVNGGGGINIDLGGIFE